MFGLFKKKKNENGKQSPLLVDLHNQPIQAGDKVESLRYDLGVCKVVHDDKGHVSYESVQSGKTVSWVLMVDAATSYQKVIKIDE